MRDRLLTDKERDGLLEDLSSLKDNPIKIIDPKEAFVDTVNPYKYIELDSNALAFDRVAKVLGRNLKMTLIYGSPGTGKSMFLSRLHNMLLEQAKYSILISSPILEEHQLFQTISFEIFKESSLNMIPDSFNNLIEVIKSEDEYISRIRPILLLDEAQLYSNNTLEKIRILADTQKIRVIFVVHQLKEENIFTQEHFKSRIWEKIELRNASINELKIYIQKKLMNVSMLQLANQFTKRVVRNIYKITKGNYRVTNNLLYSYFNNYPQLYKPQFQKDKLKVRSKEIEITAIQIRFLSPHNLGSIDVQHLPTAENEWKNWKKREYIKYLLIFLIPAILYILLNIFLHEDPVNVTSHKNLDVGEFPADDVSEVKEKIIENNISFEPPEYQKIIEVENLETDILENEILDDFTKELIEEFEEEFQDIQEDNISSNDFENLETFEEDIEKNRTELFEKQEIISENFEVKIEDEFEIEDIEDIEDIPFKQIVFKKKKSVEDNTPFSKIDLNPIFFRDPIRIYPNLPFLDNFQEYSTEEPTIEDDYVISLQSKFQKNRDIYTVIKIIDYYKVVKNESLVYKFSLELNKLNSNLKEPYLNIVNILISKGLFEEADKIKIGCKNCEF